MTLDRQAIEKVMGRPSSIQPWASQGPPSMTQGSDGKGIGGADLGELIYLPFENRLANGRLSRQTPGAGGLLLETFWKRLAVRFWDKAGLILILPLFSLFA
jgi:hypothetical protein